MKHERRTNSKLELMFLEIMDKATSGNKKMYISNIYFDEVSKTLYNTKLKSVINKRFGQPEGNENGVNVLKQKHGYKIREEWTREKVINRYYELYLLSDSQLKEKDIKNSGLSMSPVYRLFESHLKALQAMYEEKEIKKEVKIPPNIKPNKGETIGDSLEKYNIGLIEGPVNEQGVVFLFAKIHKLIGFPLVEKPQQKFPDCRATCERAPHKNKRVNIEFKYKSSTTFKGGRSIEEYVKKDICYLICWENDSKGITDKLRAKGIEVIDLKSELESLHNKIKLSLE